MSLTILLAFLFGGLPAAVGLVTYLFPPKKINNWYGYRTKASMSSQENWDEAQKLSTKIMIISGLVSFPITFTILYFSGEKIAPFFLLLIGIFSFLPTFIITELHFKNKSK